MASSAELQLLFTGKDSTAAAFANVRGHLDGLDKSLQTSNTHASNLGGTLLKLGGGAVAGVGVAVAGLATAVGVAGLKFDSFKQQSEIAFTTILGSSDAAKAHLGQLADFAAKTPFEFPDVVRASQRLQAMGIESGKVIPTLTAIGDAVAAMGGGSAQIDRVTTAIGQMNAKGKVSSEEMLQLTEAGIPAWQMLADKIGVSVPEAMKLVERGAVDANTGITALTDGMEQKFAGMMDKQSHSAAGLLSTLKDTFGQASGEVMAPFFELATHGMERVVQLTSDPAFQEGVKGFAQGLADATAAGVEFVSRVVDELGRVDWDTILGAGKAALDGIVTAATAVVDYVSAHWPEIQSTAEAIFTAVQTAVQPIIEFVVTEMQRVVDGVKENWPEIQTAVETVFHAIETVVGAVVVVVKALWDQFGEDIKNIVSTAATFIGDSISNAMTIIGGALKLVMDLINGDWSKAWKDVQTIVGGFKDQLGAVATLLKTSLADAFNLIIDLLKLTFGPQITAVTGLVSGLAAGISSVGSAAQGAIGWVKSLGNALDSLPGADQLAHLIGRSPSPLAIGIESVGDAAEGATPPLRAFAAAAQAAADAGTELLSWVNGPGQPGGFFENRTSMTDPLLWWMEQHGWNTQGSVPGATTSRMASDQVLAGVLSGALNSAGAYLKPFIDQLNASVVAFPPVIAAVEAMATQADTAAQAVGALAQAAAVAAQATAALAEQAHQVSTSESHPQTGITVDTISNFAGVRGLTKSTVHDQFGTFPDFSVPDWLLEAYGGNLVALLDDIGAERGRFSQGYRSGNRLAGGGVLSDYTLWYQPGTGRHGSMAESGPEYVVPAGGMLTQHTLVQALVEALSRAPVDNSHHTYLTRGTQLDADRAQRSYLARRRTEAGRRR